MSSPSISDGGSQLVQTLALKATVVGEIYIEEEEKEENRWISFRGYGKDGIHLEVLYAHLYGFSRINSYPSFFRYFSNHSFSGPSYLFFRVFRL